jgi:hypothetical protein
MKKVVGNLLKNKNVDQSLKEYYRRFMEINNKYAMIHLAMNYYTYYIAAKEEGMITPGYKNAIDVVNNTISDLFGKGITSEHVDTLEKVREDIIDKVSAITYYVDKYNIYEYALNRVEYRFRDFDMPVDYTDEGFTKIIMQFILEDEDNMLINAKIQDVIGQLPVRLTKGKFFELLSNGLSMYKGGTKESLNNFIYMIKTASMLGDSDKAMEKYPFLQDAFVGLCEF